MENVKNNKKLLIIGIVSILLLVIGASYAYFAISTTNNFGTHTISGTMESVGNVALTATGNSISINLSAEHMMPKGYDEYWYGSVDGTPVSDDDVYYDGIIRIADVTVTGSGNYDCDYTLSITASGTNNMYTAFQGMSSKNEGQIFIGFGDYDFIYDQEGDNGEYFDFNTANLFPITYNGHLENISSLEKIKLYGMLGVTNADGVNQTALAGTDITLSLNVTSFTCKAIKPYIVKNYVYDSSYYNNIISNSFRSSRETITSQGYNYYIKSSGIMEQTIATRDFYSVILVGTYSNYGNCAIISTDHFCVRNGDYYSLAPKGYDLIYDNLDDCEAYIDSEFGGSSDYTCISYSENDIYSEKSKESIMEVCQLFGTKEVCLNPKSDTTPSEYKAEFISAGATCTQPTGTAIDNTDVKDYKPSFLQPNKESYNITLTSKPVQRLYCSLGNNYCEITESNDYYCGEYPGGECIILFDNNYECHENSI